MWNYIFLKSVVLWPYYIWLYMKSASCLIFSYREVHEYLAWKRQEIVLRTLRILLIFGYWNILWNYLKVNCVFWMHLTCELLMWVCPCAMILVIIPSLWCMIISSLWWQTRLEAPTLHDTRKFLSVWVRLLSIGPKDYMQIGYCVMHHSLLPMGWKGKSLSVWILTCLWRYVLVTFPSL